MDNITILIPIGYKPGHIKWIHEALDSVFKQTHPVNEIFLIDDQAHLSSQWVWQTFDIFPEGLHFVGTTKQNKEMWSWDNKDTLVSLWQTPWLLGFSAAFNCGIALAENDLVIYLASDDKLAPSCVEDCLDVYHENQEKDAWYALTYETDQGEKSDIPINAAMITRGLWKYTGGYPASAFAGPDALMLSCLMAHDPYKIIKVKPGKTNYWIRTHLDQETHHQASFFLNEMNSIRTKETERFIPNPEWAKNV